MRITSTRAAQHDKPDKLKLENEDSIQLSKLRKRRLEYYPGIYQRVERNRTSSEESQYNESQPIYESVSSPNSGINSEKIVENDLKIFWANLINNLMNPWKAMLLLLIVLSIIFLFWCVCFVFFSTEKKSDLPARILEIRKQIKHLFPGQDDELWSKIFPTILASLQRDPTRPAVLLLLYKGDVGTEKTSSCLVSMIADKASKIMGVVEPEPIIVDGSKLQSDTFVTYYKPLVERQGTLVLKHLEDLSSNVAELLHYFCDVENPLVQKSMYLFTLSVDNSEGKPTYAAERYLTELWDGKIKQDSLGPLVSRLTEQVAYVKAEKMLPKNCSFYF